MAGVGEFRSWFLDMLSPYFILQIDSYILICQTGNAASQIDEVFMQVLDITVHKERFDYIRHYTSYNSGKNRYFLQEIYKNSTLNMGYHPPKSLYSCYSFRLFVGHCTFELKRGMIVLALRLLQMQFVSTTSTIVTKQKVQGKFG